MRFARLICVCVSLILLLFTGFLSILRQQESKPPYIYFLSSLSDLMRVRSDGSGLQKVVDSKENLFIEDISLNGRWIVCTYTYQNRGTILLISSNREVHREIFQINADYMNPIFSPDGNSIVFQKFQKGYLGLYRMDIKNSTVETVFEGETNWNIFSPNGNFLFFVSEMEDNRDIYRIELETDELVNLTQHEADDYSPTLSSDGQWIAFISHRNGEVALHIMRTDGTDVRRLTAISSTGVRMGWSPNNFSIAYSNNLLDDSEIYLLDINSGKKLNLSPNHTDDSFLGWSPDGKWIIFFSENTSRRGMYKMQADGLDRTYISEGFNPLWSPIIDMAWRGERLWLVGLGLLALVGVSYRFRKFKDSV